MGCSRGVLWVEGGSAVENPTQSATRLCRDGQNPAPPGMVKTL